MLRLVLADDEPLWRMGVSSLAARSHDWMVVAETDSAREMLTLCAQHVPDVLVLGAELLYHEGVGVVEQVRRTVRQTAILLAGSRDHEPIIGEAVRHGAAGFVPKTAPAEDLHQAIAAVARGDGWIPASIALQVMASTADQSRLERLTAREAEVLALLAEGMDTDAIATALHLSRSTVQNHLSNIYSKLGVHQRWRVLLLAHQLGLIRRARAVGGH